MRALAFMDKHGCRTHRSAPPPPPPSSLLPALLSLPSFTTRRSEFKTARVVCVGCRHACAAARRRQRRLRAQWRHEQQSVAMPSQPSTTSLDRRRGTQHTIPGAGLASGTGALAIPPGTLLSIMVVWVGAQNAEGEVHFWHKDTRVSQFDLPPLPPG